MMKKTGKKQVASSPSFLPSVWQLPDFSLPVDAVLRASVPCLHPLKPAKSVFKITDSIAGSGQRALQPNDSNVQRIV